MQAPHDYSGYSAFSTLRAGNAYRHLSDNKGLMSAHRETLQRYSWQLAAWFLIIKSTRCTNFSNLFWNVTVDVSNSSSVHHQEFIIVQTAIHTGLLIAARKLSANLYDIYQCCVYSEKLLMMDRGTVRNM